MERRIQADGIAFMKVPGQEMAGILKKARAKASVDGDGMR